ncbi:MAG: CDP-diacylglycerol--serine O-phosphatidyltransferase [Alphaproteobacteria bacterium]
MISPKTLKEIPFKKISPQKLKELPFRKIAPNIVTMLALCSGVTSIRYAMDGNWMKACLCIFVAAILDGLDGRVARLLKASSKFGAELDSLSDFVSFGVAPAILVYKWSLFDLPKIGWFCALLLAMASALRLARFNTMLDDVKQPKYWDNFFVGVPAPAAAMLAILPVIASFEFADWSFLRSHLLNAVVLFVVAMLMVSRIPTISTKKMKVKSYMFVPIMIFVVFFASLIISQPWLVLASLTAFYLVSIPVGVLWFLSAKNKNS